MSTHAHQRYHRVFLVLAFMTELCVIARAMNQETAAMRSPNTSSGVMVPKYSHLRVSEITQFNQFEHLIKSVAGDNGYKPNAVPTKFLAHAASDLVPVQPTEIVPYDEGHVTRDSRLNRNATTYPQPTKSRLAAKFDYLSKALPSIRKIRDENQHPMLRASKPGLTFSSSSVKKDAAAVFKGICQLSFPAKVLRTP